MGTLYYGDNLDILRRYQSISATEVHVVELHASCTGTTIDAAEKLGRDWIGIDVTQLAISRIKNRLQDAYGRRLRFVIGRAQGRAGNPLPAAGGASVPASRLVSSLAPPDSIGAHGVTRPTESLVHIIGEPTTPNEAATLAESDQVKPSQTKSGQIKLNQTKSSHP